MKEYEIVAVKHDERRNGERTPMYWSIDSDEDGKRFNDHDQIYDQWFCKELPKRILKVLETAPEDFEDWGLKRGKFILVLKNAIKFDDFGKVNDFENIVSITLK